ncbi:TPM domain-containing protein [Sediminibacterium ginsengisoli]|uniref:TLP18.3, Psb32 and MOLO-1 founding protein of phosphatase n=1 Tax=Sediminibacterium ginsengisoli TaxID=413434 RepID=A0A1T4KCH5_9BACT|nr:TPM domain-containing protein [Sediminibacterium ginsengisoli]SJZ40130.1 TLP18.3, Psb32 and MOLO-1 founding protein of phosphatase [Sediminibacterium ginsengisoli]
MLGLFRKKAAEYFSPEEKKLIVEAIQQAEQKTSGEVRVFIESRCRLVNPLHRALEVFASLKMEETAQRNAVLVYVAMKDRQLAIYGDEGIHSKVGTAFWNEEVQKMLQQFNRDNHAEGLAQIIREIGEALVQHFPYDVKGDKNELPDDIVFGK